MFSWITIVRQWLFGKKNRQTIRKNKKKQELLPFVHLRVEQLEMRWMPSANWYVNGSAGAIQTGSQTQPFATIQEGVNAAAPGDTVNVAQGTYNPASAITITNQVTLLGGWDSGFTTRSPGANVTTVQPTYTGASNLPDVVVNGANTTIDGFDFVFDNTGTRNSEGVQVGATGVTFSDNTVYVGASSGSPRSDGLVTSGATTGLQVLDNTFLVNAGADSTGIFIDPDSTRVDVNHTVTISDNTIEGSGMGSAIIVDTNGYVSITDNTIARTSSAPVGYDLIGLRARTSGTPLSNVTISGDTINSDGADGSVGISLSDLNEPASPQTESIANITISNNLIENGSDGITVGSAGGAASQSISATVFANSFVNNNATSVIPSANLFIAPAADDYLGTAAIDASGNWWGTNIGSTPSDPPMAINASISGTNASVTLGSFLNSGNTTASVGFTPAAATEMWVPETAATSGLSIVNGNIQEGINSALSGMTVRVAADTYAEELDITKPVTLAGAQAGVDARTRSGAESIIMGLGINAPVLIEAGVNNVTIDGFTIESPAGGSGQYNAGIYTNGSTGLLITNDILENNTTGVAIANSGGTISYDLIQGNNAPGAGAGNGIEFFAGDTIAWHINNNKFTNNSNGDVLIAAGAPVSNVTVSDNSFDSSSGIFALEAANLQITGNTFTTPVYDAIYVGGGDSGITISSNIVTGIAVGNAAVHIDNYYGVGANSNVTISDNTLNVNGLGGAAIAVTDDGTPGGAYSGNLTVSGDTITTTGTDLSIRNESTTPIDATGETFNTQLASSASTAQLYAIEDTLIDGIDVSGFGLVRLKANSLYVTPNSFYIPDGTSEPSIQNAINVASPGDTVHIAPGTYGDTVNITQSVTVIDGSSGDNTFNVMPASGAINLTGATGDMLTLDTAGLISPVLSGNATSGSLSSNLGTVTWSGFGSLSSLSGSSLTIDSPADANITLSGSATSPTYSIGGGASAPLPGGVGSIVASGGTLTVNFANGDPVPNGISFDGGGTGTLNVVGGNFTTVTDNLTGAGAGNITLQPTGGGGNTTVSYTGLAPVLMNFGNATNEIFNLPAGANATVTAGASGFDTLTSTNATFETTTFANPLGSLTINGNATNTANLAIDSLDAGFAANLTVNNNGTGTGAVTVAGPLDIGSNSLVIDSQTTNDNALITAGSITGNASIVNVASPATIQSGVDLAGSGATVNVAAGTYVGGAYVDNTDGVTAALYIDKALTLIGPNAAYDPNSNPVPTNPQAILEPGASDPNLFDVNDVVVIEITASNVTIRGLTVNGSNDATPSFVHYQFGGSPVELGGVGVPIDAAEGIVSDRGVGNISVSNNIVENTAYTGIDFYNADNPASTSDNVVSKNLVENLADTFGYGIGVLIYQNFYAQVTDNDVSNVWVGIQTGNYSKANNDAGFEPQISDNAISARRRGIYYNLHYTNASPFTIADNTITAVAEPVGGTQPRNWDGIMISSQQPLASATFENNDINGTGATFTTASDGYDVWNDPTSGPLTISDGIVTGVQYGVWLNSYEGTGGPGDATSAVISGVNIAASQIGVYVEDSSQTYAFTPVAVSATIEGNTTITGGATGIEVSGADAIAQISGNTAISGATVGVNVDGGTASITGANFATNGVDLQILGASGGDKFTAIYSGGNISLSDSGGAITLNTPAGNISTIDVIGNGGNNVLSISGNGSQTAIYTPSTTTTGDGTVSVTGGPTFSFSGLTPVDIDNMANVTVDMPPTVAGSNITVSQYIGVPSGTDPNGVPNSQSTVEISNPNDTPAIEPAFIWNVGSLTLATPGGASGTDTIDVAGVDFTKLTGANVTNVNISMGTNASDAVTFDSGNTTLTGNLTVGANGTLGNINVNGPVQSVSGNVTFTAANILEGPNGTITAGLLTTSSINGTSLTGTNAVGNFTASDSAGFITLDNTGNLNIDGIIESGGGDINVATTGNLTVQTSVTATTGNISLTTSAGNLTVNAPISDASPGSINLTANAGNITDGASAVISTNGTLTTVSATGTTLNGSTNVVSNFNATDTSAIGVTFFDACTSLDVTGITANASIGPISVKNTGGDIIISGNINADPGAGNVTLNASGAITETTGVITAGNLTTTSGTGTTLNGSTGGGGGTPADYTYGGGQSTFLSPISLGTGGFLTPGTIYYYVVVAIGASLGNVESFEVAAPMITSGNQTAELNWSDQTATSYDIYRSTKSGDYTDSVMFTVDGSTLSFNDTGAGGSSSPNFVVNFNATDPGPNGVSLNDAVTTLNVTSISAGIGPISLTNTGTITQTGAITGASLTTTSTGGTTLANVNNAVSAFGATDTGLGSAGVSFNNTIAVNITGISADSGNITVNNSGGTIVSGTVTTDSATISLKDLTGGISVGNGVSIFTTTSGDVDLTGTGGTSSAGLQDGVFADQGSNITAAGNVNLIGIGGNSTGNSNDGVELLGTVTAADILTIDGNGGGTGANSSNNYGIYLNGATLTGGNVAAGTNAVVLLGYGGNSTFNGTPPNDAGIVLTNSAEVTTSGTGNVSVTGYGGSSGSADEGVFLENVGNSTITSEAGDVNVFGTGGGTTDNNAGVYVGVTDTISSGTNGNIVVTGNSGNAGGGENYGVEVIGTISANGTGTVMVTGTSHANEVATATGNNDGVDIEGLVTSGNATVGGNVTVTGTAGNTVGSDAIGVLVGGAITSAGNVTVMGTGGAAANGTGAGVELQLSLAPQPFVSGTGSGDVKITGIAGSGSTDIVLGADTTVSASDSNITLTGNSMLFDKSAAINAANGHIVTLQNRTFGTLVNVITDSPTQNAIVGASNGTLMTGTPYYYVITAIGASGEGLQSNEEFFTPDGGMNTADLSWDAVAAATGYNIYRSTTSGGYTNSLIETINSGATTTYSDAGNLTGAGTPPSPGANGLSLNNGELQDVTASILRVGSSTAGNITIGDAVSLTNVTTLSLISNGTVSENTTVSTATITVANLSVKAVGNVNLTQTNSVGDLAANVTGSGSTFSFNNSIATLTIGIDDNVTGITTANGTVAVINAGNLTVNQNVTTTGKIAAVNLTASVTNDTLTNNANISGGNITLTADHMALMSTSTINASNVAGHIVTLQPYTDGTLINLGGDVDVAGNLTLSNLALQTVTGAGVLRIGEATNIGTDSGTINAGNISVTDAIILNPGNVSTLTLITGGNVAGNATGSITDTNLALQTVTGVSGANSIYGGSLVANVTNLAFNNTGSGNVVVSDYANGGVTINLVDTLTSSTNGGGGVKLYAASPITFNVATTSNGTLTATALDDDPPSGTDLPGNITVNANIMVTTTAGDVDFEAGDDIIIQTGATVSAQAGNVTLASDSTNYGNLAMGDGDGNQTIDGTVAANATVTISLGNVTTADTGVNESANGSIQAANLALVSQGVSNVGPNSFNLSLGNNSVSYLAANTTGSINFNDGAANLTIGTVPEGPIGNVSIAGINSNGANVTLTTTGNVTIGTGAGENITASGATVDFNVGGASEQTGSIITATNFRLRGAGNFTFNNNNDITNLAANITGNLSFNDAANLTVTTVTGTDGNTTTGIVSNGGNITLTTNAATSLNVNSDVNSANGNITFTTGGMETLDANTTSGTGVMTFNAATGGISQTGGNLSGSYLQVLTGDNSTVSLNSANNTIGTLAANIGTGGIGGNFSFTDNQALTVGVAGGTIGIQSNGGNITLTTTGGAASTLTVSNDVISSNGNATFNTSGGETLAANIALGTGTLTLNATVGGANQTNGNITAGNLLALTSDASNVTLTDANNTVSGNIAANMAGGNFNYTTSGNLTVGTVGSTSGIVTGPTIGNITLLAAGNLTVDEIVKTGTGSNGTFIQNGGFTENPPGTVMAGDNTTIRFSSSQLDIIINSNQTFGNISLTAPRDIIIGANLSSTIGNITLVAGANYSVGGVGEGGVWVESNGTVSSAGNLTVSGKHLFDAAANGSQQNPDSVLDAILLQGPITANGAINLSTNLTAPNAPTGAGTFLGVNGTVITSANSSVTINNPVTLTANTTIAAKTNVTFNSTIDGNTAGNQSLTVNASGTTTFEAPVGNTTSLSSLTIDSHANLSGTTDLNGGIVTTTGNQTYNDKIILTANDTLTSTGGTVTFNNTVNDNTTNTHSLTIDGNAVLGLSTSDFIGQTTHLGSLTVNGNTTIGTQLITTGANSGNGTGTQTYNGALTLNTSPTLVGTTITFNQTVDGSTPAQYGLTIGNIATVANSGSAVFDGYVGSLGSLSSLSVAGNTTFNAGDNGGANITVTTSNVQTYSGPVTLGADAQLYASSPSKNITFGSTVDGAFNLTVNTSGVTVFDGNVGGTTALASVFTDAPGTTDINGSVVNTTGAQTYLDAVDLTSNATLTSTASGNITFNQTVDGNYSLTVNSGGTTLFNGAVGNTTNLVSLSIDPANTSHGLTDINGGTVTTSGNQTYNDQVALSANTTLSGGNITFGNTLDSVPNNANSLTITGNAAFHGQVGLGSFPGGNSGLLTSLSVSGTTDIFTNAIDTSGNQNYTGNATVHGGVNPTLSSTSGTVTFGANLNDDTPGDDVVEISANAVFDGFVGNNVALGALKVDGTTLFNGGNAGAATVHTTGGQLYLGAVTLGANTTLREDDTPGGTRVEFDSTVDGNVAGSWSLAITGNAGVGGNLLLKTGAFIGSNTPLSSLTVAGNSTLSAGNSGANTTTTTGLQSFNGAVTLGADATLDSTTSGNITFNKTVNGGYNLTVNTFGITKFNGNVGGTTALVSVTTDAGGTTDLNGSVVNTTGAQTYNDAVILSQNETLNSTGNGNVTFATTVDGAYSLTVNTSGVTTFNGNVGGATALVSVTTDAGGTTDLNGSVVNTTGTQTYNDAVILSQNETLNSTGSGNVTFATTVDGNYSLTVNTSGVTTFNGNVGVAPSALVSVTTDVPAAPPISTAASSTTTAMPRPTTTRSS